MAKREGAGSPFEAPSSFPTLEEDGSEGLADVEPEASSSHSSMAAIAPIPESNRTAGATAKLMAELMAASAGLSFLTEVPKADLIA